MLHDAPDEFTKETAHLLGLYLVLFNLAKQFRLFLAQVSFLWTTILTRRMILLLILLQLIDLLLLLAHGQNSIGAIILMNSWLMYLANLLTHLMLIRLLDLILIQGELKPASLTSSIVLSLTSSIISCSNVTYCQDRQRWTLFIFIFLSFIFLLLFFCFYFLFFYS